jgi:hypothetical protein
LVIFCSGSCTSYFWHGLKFLTVEESNNDISATSNFQGLSLRGEELAVMKFAEDNQPVIIPDQMEVTSTGCVGLNLGSFLMHFLGQQYKFACCGGI